MMPEIVETLEGRIVGVIIGLPLGKYEASVWENEHSNTSDRRIVRKSFEELDDARNWVITSTLWH